MAGFTDPTELPPLSTPSSSSLPPPPSLPPHPDTAPPPLLRPAVSLVKQKSWSPNSYREELWIRRKEEERRRRKRSKSVTDDDVDELKACIELGFGFEDSPEMDPRLSHAFPAYELYYTVNKHYNETISNKKTTATLPPPSSSNSSCSSSPLPACSECGSSTPSAGSGSPLAIINPGEDPKKVKTKLRQWAQVVACSVRQSNS